MSLRLFPNLSIRYTPFHLFKAELFGVMSHLFIEMTLFGNRVDTNSGKCEHPKPENRDFSFKLGIIRFIPSFYVYVQMKIFRLPNQNPYIDRPESAHRPRKIHILSNRKLSNYPVGVRPSSRRPHPNNAKLFLSIYRLCRASAGFIRPHPGLIPASPHPHQASIHSIFPLPELDSSGPSTGPLGPTPFLPFFLIRTQASDTDSFEELKLCPCLRMFFLYFQGFSCSFRFSFPLSFSGFLKGREQEGKRKNEDR